jgi:hypothetical protein
MWSGAMFFGEGRTCRGKMKSEAATREDGEEHWPGKPSKKVRAQEVEGYSL